MESQPHSEPGVSSYSFPPYGFPFIVPILLFHSIPPHSALAMTLGGSAFIRPAGFHICDGLSPDVPDTGPPARKYELTFIPHHKLGKQAL